MAEAIVAASYERVSTRIQGQTGFSLGGQRESNEQFALARGWELPNHLRFRDGEGINASGADWNLPALNAMLEAAQRREFRYLIVPDRDRLARDMLKAKILEDQLKKYAVHVVYLRAPTEESPEGELTNNVLHSLSQFERAKTRYRTMNGRRDKARTGRVVGNGGKAPYGHRLTYETLDNGHTRVAGMEPDPTTGPIAVRIVRLVRTHSLWRIAEMLNAEGIPSPEGCRWWSGSVRRVATDRVHIGVWRYADEIEVAVPPLLAGPAWAAEWQEAQEALTERRGRSGARVTKAEDQFLLRSLLTCGHCGAVLTSNINNKVRYYECSCHEPARAQKFGKPTCELPAVPANPLENEAWDVVSETLLDPEKLDAGLQAARNARSATERMWCDQRAIIDSEIAKHRATIKSLVDQLATFTSTALIEAIDQRAKELDGLIGSLSRQRDSLDAGPGEGLTKAEADSIREFAETARIGLAEATPAERRELFDTLRLRGFVSADPNGVQLGRRHRFQIDWEARMHLSRSETGFENRVSRYGRKR
jgi:site-specific DNA recombinase